MKNKNVLMITESIFTYFWGFTLNLTASVDVYKQSDQLLRDVIYLTSLQVKTPTNKTTSCYRDVIYSSLLQVCDRPRRKKSFWKKMAVLKAPPSNCFGDWLSSPFDFLLEYWNEELVELLEVPLKHLTCLFPGLEVSFESRVSVMLRHWWALLL